MLIQMMLSNDIHKTAAEFIKDYKFPIQEFHTVIHKLITENLEIKNLKIVLDLVVIFSFQEEIDMKYLFKQILDNQPSKGSKKDPKIPPIYTIKKLINNKPEYQKVNLQYIYIYMYVYIYIYI